MLLIWHPISSRLFESRVMPFANVRTIYKLVLYDGCILSTIMVYLFGHVELSAGINS